MPPVKQNFVFEKIVGSDTINKLNCLPLDCNLWEEFEFHELAENMRQKEDEPFFNLLNRVRLGNPSNNDLNELNSRLLNINDKNQKIEETATLFLEKLKQSNKTVCILPKIKDVDKFNTIVSKQLNIEIVTIDADDTKYNKRGIKKNNMNAQNKIVKNNKSLKKNNETAGLDKTLCIGIGSRVMLRRNINCENGLVNGALGFVTKIVKNQYNHVFALDIQFDNIKSISRIERYAAQFEVEKNIYITRHQFPINLAWAFSIHKSQGLSLDNVFIDLGEDIFQSGMAYVALSRAR